MHRRKLLTSGVSLFAGACLNRLFASQYSARAVDLVAQSNVIDMLGLLTLNWPLLDRWHQDPSALTDSDFQKLRSSGIDVFHPAVALETAQSYAVTRAWFEKWNRLIARRR